MEKDDKIVLFFYRSFFVRITYEKSLDFSPKISIIIIVKRTKEETEMTKEKMFEMIDTLNEMIARSEERQRILKEMIAESTAEVETLEKKLAAFEK